MEKPSVSNQQMTWQERSTAVPAERGRERVANAGALGHVWGTDTSSHRWLHVGKWKKTRGLNWMRSLAFSVFCFARWKSSGDEFHHNVNILNINWTPQLKIARMVNLMFFHNSKMLNFKKYLFLFISLAAPGLTCGTQDLFFFFSCGNMNS